MNAPTVLIIDDNEQSRYVHARYLRLAGFEVLEAPGGAQGLGMAPKADAILLDVRLPDMSGTEVCRRLKNDPATAWIPVLQTSASFVSVQDKVAGLQGGADAYLTVPLEPAELVATIHALLRLHRAEADAQRMAEAWQATFDAIGDGICLLDAETRIVRFNRAFAARFSTAEPAAGRLLVEALRLDDPAKAGRFLVWPPGRAGSASAPIL